jgi:carbon-monoxide dehydrogenase small subunit
MKQMLNFTLNGEDVEVYVSPTQMLITVIREDLHLHGTKQGCDSGECGCCTVILNGKAVTSCLIPALKAQGAVVETIEGLGTPNNLHPIQKSFVQSGAIQCGYCIPGMVMSAKALLDKNLDPTPDEVRNAIAGNICRCTGYVKIEEAILGAAKEMRKGASK